MPRLDVGHARITGTVLTLDGSVVEGASVAIANAPEPVADIALLTGADGRFLFDDLPAGRYIIEAHAAKGRGAVTIEILDYSSTFAPITVSERGGGSHQPFPRSHC
ncbi:carboxypeptidase-like regulatory domain-containing protein [Sedimentitalea todarodis]|uniref:carboxypeptidase-like regulatory domain-containing protein n=1 Tax=Sedimentitalea todarodis TaxID=1631240 RepID=UPI00374290F1